MTKIKLKEWADRNGLNYLTANRHFHAGMIPGATQLPSGTILVEDDSPEQNMSSNSPSDAMSLFLKKTVEFSKNNSSVEDFAAYVISNFTIRLPNTQEPSPKYSKNRPKPEEVQKHFQQFLPDKKKQEHLKAIKNLIETERAVEPLPDGVVNEPNPFTRGNPEPTGMDAEYESMGKEILDHMYGSDAIVTGGLVNRSVDFDTTPQQINYTGSNGQVSSSFGATSAIVGDTCFNNSGSLSAVACAAPVASSFILGNNAASLTGTVASGSFNAWPAAAAGAYFTNSVSSAFQPTQKELLSAAQVIETAETEDAPRGKRGRKPSKKR